MYLNNAAEFYLKYCEQRIEELERRIAGLPEGSLQICRSGNYYSWKLKTQGGKRTYLPRSQADLAKQLAGKKLCEAQLADMRSEAKACRRYLQIVEQAGCREEALLEASPEFKTLLGRAARTREEKVQEWENEPYSKSTRYPEHLIFSTFKKDEKVRSKLEATFAGLLLELNLPYKYEKILTFEEAQIAVDFTVLDVRNFREVPIELFGMMDNEDYQKSYCVKMRTYMNHGYFQGVNFLAFCETAASPLSPVQMKSALEDFFFRYPPVIL